NGVANLFFLNPSGIVFGRNAQLNVGGSFVGSTANAIQFGNLGIFSASTPNTPTPLLTINPSALLFTQTNPGVITNQSIAPAQQDLTNQNVTGLRVPDGKSLLLVGGNINIDGGGLRAYGGNIELTGLAAPGNVGLNIVGNSLTSVVPNGVERADVSLNNGAELNVRGANGGDIKIQARNLNLAGQSKLRAGIESGLGTADSRGGNVEINATGTTNLTEQSFISNSLLEQSSGKTGDISITTESLRLSNGAALSSTTFGQGNAGSISIQANSVTFANGDIFSNVESGGIGRGGDINIKAGSLTLTEGAQLQTSVKKADGTLQAGRGDAGNVNLDVSGKVSITGVNNGLSSAIFSDVGTDATGNAGNINVKAGSFELSNGAQLSSSTFGQGNAGNVSIQASNAVSLAGKNTGILSNVESGGIGHGGDINIKAGSLTLTEGAQLQTSVNKADGNLRAGRGDAGNVNLDVSGKVTITGVNNELPSAIFSRVETDAIGNGGNINIKAGSFELSDGARLSSSTFGQGNAGSVSIQASNAVSLAGKNTTIFSNVDSGGIGRGGDINIKAGSLTLTEGAQLQTSVNKADGNLQAGRGDAGNLNLDVSGKVTITGLPSAIFSNVGTGATGSAGNINVKSGSLELSNGAQLDSSTSGQGNAGNVNLEVLGKVTITGVNNGFPTAIFSNVGTGATGSAGNINVKSGSFELSNGAQLDSSTSGQGNAGRISIQTSNAVSLANGDIFSTVQSGGVGHGGDINIKAGSLSLTEGAQLQTSVNKADGNFQAGRGDAGNVNLDVSGKLTITGVNSQLSSAIFSNVEMGATGNGGNINVKAGSFELSNAARLNSSTFGQGNAGSISIQASNGVSLASSYILSNVAKGAVGNAGNINIQAGSFSLTDESQVTANNLGGKGSAGNILINTANDVSIRKGAFVSGFSQGEGNAGKITIRSGGAVSISGRGENTTSGVASGILSPGMGNAGDIEIRSRSFLLSDGAFLSGTPLSGAVGNAGNISISTIDDFTLKNNASIETSTDTRGNAGNITIHAGGNVFISQQSSLNSTVGQNAVGSGGNIEISGRNFSLSDKSRLFTPTIGKGNAGNFQINTTGDITLTNGAQIRSDTVGMGNAGNVTVNAGGTFSVDGISSDGSVSGISTQVGAEQGFVGIGKAGDININARSIKLDNQGTITASTSSGDGGNINLKAADYLLLRRNSSISTTAGTTQSKGNGGNITINTPFVIAVRGENTDITANAFSGSGGRITINAAGIFNIAPLSLQDLKKLRPSDVDPRQLPTNNITAVSQQNPELSGAVQINTPDVDPSKGLITLPTVSENTPKLVSSSCAAFDEANGGSNFAVTGRGGLPPNPYETLSSDAIWSDTRLPVTTAQQRPPKTRAAKIKPKPIEIVPATGWVFNDKGEVTLISSVSKTTSSSTPMSCPVK
ncbi:beta strand repeat-containing protein, partial [Aetokthonos hydrillicola]